jgi:starch synthase
VKILLIATEAYPFAKTGGLGDVCSALPRALNALGHDVRVIIPNYSCVDKELPNPETILPEVIVRLPYGTFFTRVLSGTIPNTEVPIYFIDHAMFRRDGLYGENGHDYPDNGIRFSLFCMAALWTLKGIGWQPDIIQCNDWQTGLVPTFLRASSMFAADAFYQKPLVYFCIHNLAYQGRFHAGLASAIGLPHVLYPAGFEFFGGISLLKAGIVYSDWVGTVSRTYAQEIQTLECGCGLDDILRNRKNRLVGILNGVDYTLWNPATDRHLPANYNANDLSGKAKCKAAAQQQFGLPVKPKVPLISMVSRLDTQKGFDLVEAALPRLTKSGAQFIFIGTGNQEIAKTLRHAHRQYPGIVHTSIRFDDRLAHLAEAGADAFLMPSRYEPCGLNQMYSLRYGTIPIVRHTGGLAIHDATPASIQSGRATGFSFEEYDPEELAQTVERAVNMYRHKHPVWKTIQLAGMRADYAWLHSAREYEKLFERMMAEGRG